MPHEKDQSFGELLIETMAEWAKIEKDVKDGKPIPPPAPRLRGQGITRNEGSRGGFYLEDHPGLGMMEEFDDDTDELSDSTDEINEQIDRLLFDK